MSKAKSKRPRRDEPLPWEGTSRILRAAPRVASYALSVKEAHSARAPTRAGQAERSEALGQLPRGEGKNARAIDRAWAQLELEGAKKQEIEKPSSAIACVHIPILPLQRVLRDEPSWRTHPVVVIDSDKPTAKILFTNGVARRMRIMTGMRYATARSVTPELRARVHDEAAMRALNDDLVRGLLLLTPSVEKDDDEPGLFFLDPSGLERLFGEPRVWAESVHRYLVGRGLSSSVVVGFHRFRTEAIARSRRGVLVLGTPDRERDLALQTRLDRIQVSPDLRDALAKLGVRRLGEVLALSRDALHTRFGEELSSLHDRAQIGAPLPVQPFSPVDPPRLSHDLEPAEEDTTRLLFTLQPLVRSLIAELTRRGDSLVRIALHFALDAAIFRARANDEEKDEAPTIDLSIEPAKPTRDEGAIIDLLRLRLAALTLRAPVVRADLVGYGTRHETAQLELFERGSRRDLEAAARGIARVRAAYGEASVTRARLTSGHLPEASFTWEPTSEVTAPKPAERETEAQPMLPFAKASHLSLVPSPSPQPPQTPRLARVLFAKPVPLRDASALVKLAGPHRWSGGWWVRTVERDYYYAETRDAELLWVFYDRQRQRWFVHGKLE